ncbi:Hypothetical predicted protein [Paramuricea clavata]|uniref:Uncharacterized protein n=1 Tax=Paramuricea clavata TaxID=317549 RepID=A0A6S7GZH1_PARCT|nr:Hypothetical predicted protein [Paramuricea clavata]
MKGGFDTIRDFIAVDDQTGEDEMVKSDNPNTPDLTWPKHPRMAVIGIDREGIDGKELYSIPVEWIPRVAVRDDGLFVLKSFEFCCREILVRSKTQLVRCQSLTVSDKYYVDKHYFHVGSGDCDEDNSEIEVFAATHLYVGLKSIMHYFNTGLYVNMGEMLMALDCNEENLKFYHKEVRYEESSITVIYTPVEKKDQSVENHPFSSYDELDCDGYNHLGLPVLRYVLDADFDSLAAKAYYGVIDGHLDTPCMYVDAFMQTYAIKHV